MNAAQHTLSAEGTANSRLRAFLRSRRSCVTPASCGLPVRLSRRSQGLGREEMAELLEVTPVWYSLFESGKSGRRFSADFVRRVASVLRLDASEHDMLCRLVVEGGRAACDLDVEWRWTRLFTLVAQASQSIAGARSSALALAAAVDALRSLFADRRATVTLDSAPPCSRRDTVAVSGGATNRRITSIPLDRNASIVIEIESSAATAFASAEIVAVETIATCLKLRCATANAARSARLAPSRGSPAQPAPRLRRRTPRGAAA